MKKKILSVLLGFFLLMGIISVNASSIIYEEPINEEINVMTVDETNITPLMATNDIVTYADSDGTLEFVKTIQGNSYTAFIREDSSSMYWSNSTSYDAKYEPYINVPEFKNANCPYSSYGSRTAEKVPIYTNVYLPKGSILYFHLNGSSCSHSGSTATLYLSDAYSSPVAYNSDNQKYNIGTMVVTSGQNANGTDFYYTIHKSGYYTVDAIGQAIACNISYGHGIYMNQTYYIYRYKYDISYNLNDGNLSKVNPTYYYEENDDIVLNNPTKTGYTFIGWTENNGITPSTSVTIPTGSTGNKSYTANWRINQYPVTYIDVDANGNEIGRTTKLADYDTLVKGSDIGDDKTDNAYYPQYRYVSDTSEKVTTDGAVVYRVFEFCETEAKANLQWNDNNNADGFRPEKYKLKLKQNGKVIDEIELSSDETNYTFSNLPIYDSNGNAYKYTFDVDASNRYQIVFDEDGNLIVEDYLPANFSVTIPKTIVLDGNTGNAILLISDSYLKSANCMYEVLEVMRDRNYRDKIFPAVIDSGIYSPVTRAKYVKHWQDEFKELESTLKEINVQNLGKLNEDLKRRQDISSNIAEFLDVVSDMNNPNIADVCIGIEEKLCQKGFLGNRRSQISNANDIFATLGIPKTKFNAEPTDLEISQFVRESFNQIVKLLSQLCQQYQTQNAWVQVQIEQVDTRTVIYQFFINGQLARGLKLFLSNMLGGGRENIGLSDNTMSFGGGNSWNGMYDAKFIDGELKLYATMSFMNSQKTMTVEEVVADIWEHYIQIYLER